MLDSHLNAYNETIFCMRPLVKINFDEHSMLRDSPLY